MYCEKCGIHYAVEMRDGEWLCEHCLSRRNEEKHFTCEETDDS